jgi:hypothetical protein
MSPDPILVTLARGSAELLTPVAFLQRVLLWTALQPEGVRNELMRRELVAFEARRLRTSRQGTTIP